MKQRLPRTQTSLFKTCAQRKAGRRQLYPSHGPLRFITSHSFRARLCHAKNEAPEEEAVTVPCLRQRVIILSRKLVSFCTQNKRTSDNSTKGLFIAQK